MGPGFAFVQLGWHTLQDVVTLSTTVQVCTGILFAMTVAAQAMPVRKLTQLTADPKWLLNAASSNLN